MTSLDKGNGFGFTIETPTCYWGTPDFWSEEKALFQIDETSIRLATAHFHRQDENGIAVSDATYFDLRHYLIGRSRSSEIKWYCYLGNGHYDPYTVLQEGNTVVVFSEPKLTRIDVLRSRAVVESPLYEGHGFAEACRVIVPDFERIDQELVAYFAKHPEELHNLRPEGFERLLEAIFRDLGYQTELCAGPGDLGVDLRLVFKDSIAPMVTLVQAKRYHPKNPIRLEAVQALYGAVEAERANRGLFVTTSRYLPGVMEFAKRNSRRIVLADAEQVARWCDALRVFRDAAPAGKLNLPMR